MVRGNARIHLGGPEIVKAAIKEVVDAETLGGAEMHTLVSGVNDYLVDTEAEALLTLRDIVAKLNRATPQHMATRPPMPPKSDPADLGGIIPADAKTPYDVRDVIARLTDGSDFQEFKPAWGATLVCGFAHMHGQPVGILANNGVLFAESAVKGAHFIELCNQRNIPLLFLQNITGFMVGTEAERGGIAKHSAKLVYAVSTARVPRFTVIIARVLWRRKLRHVRPRLRPALPVRLAERTDRDDEPRSCHHCTHRAAWPQPEAGRRIGR